MTTLPANYVYCICGHTPCDGLDCGVYLPGGAPRKKPAPRPPEEVTASKKQAWETRRAKYGKHGHRGYARAAIAAALKEMGAG